MDIHIRVFKEAGAEPEERAVQAGTSVEELLLEYRSRLPYRAMTARVDNEGVSLAYLLDKDCDVRFCDIRDDAANRAFQRSLCFVFLKAVRDALGPGAKAVIRNSVNRGIYTTIVVGGAPASESDLRMVEKRMWQLVDANLPIAVETVGKAALLAYLSESGMTEKLGLLESAPDVRFVSVARLDGYTNYFYGLMLPSTGYVTPFALDAYHGGALLRFPHPTAPHAIAQYTKDDRIFEAYEEEQRALDEAGLAYISDLGRAISEGRAGQIIRMAEGRHAERIADIARQADESGRRVVLLAGPSSSGKTTTAKRLIGALEGRGRSCLYLGTDDYFVERADAPRDRHGEFNFEGLDAMDVALFERDINALLAGGEVDLPRFDFITGKKVFGERRATLPKDAIIVIEGIHALNRKMSKGIDDASKFKIYISPLTQLNIDDHNRVPSTDVRLLRRMLRDYRTRGYGVQKTLQTWPKVRAGESVNIFPYNNEADAVFNSTLVYELPVLRKHLEPLLEGIHPEDDGYGQAKWLLHFLRFFAVIEDEAPIPPESVLREFIG